MNPNAPQAVVRTLLVGADHLSRLAYAHHDDDLSMRFAALRTELARLERRIGAAMSRPTSRGEVDLVYQRVLDLAAKAVGHESRELLDNLVRVAQRLRPPAPRTLMGFPAPRTLTGFTAPRTSDLPGPRTLTGFTAPRTPDLPGPRTLMGFPAMKRPEDSGR